MPIYEYQCEKCDCHFEQLVSPGDKKPAACPKCRSQQVKKCISCFSSTGIQHDSGCRSSGSSGFS